MSDMILCSVPNLTGKICMNAPHHKCVCGKPACSVHVAMDINGIKCQCDKENPLKNEIEIIPMNKNCQRLDKIRDYAEKTLPTRMGNLLAAADKCFDKGDMYSYYKYLKVVNEINGMKAELERMLK